MANDDYCTEYVPVQTLTPEGLALRFMLCLIMAFFLLITVGCISFDMSTTAEGVSYHVHKRALNEVQ
mgnify:CR=1 FL=1